MPDNLKSRVFLLAGLGTSAMSPVAAFAQGQAQSAVEAPSAKPDSPDAGAIVVTAQRRAQNLQKVPVSVTVVSGAELAERNIRTLADLSEQTPSLKITQAPASDQLHIRGFGSGYNPGFEQSVATFVDGAYRNRSRSSRVALFDVEQVEVLKGPQTLFFGANAIAGALNITTRKPGSTFEANASSLVAPADGEYDVEAGISIPVTADLSVRLAGRLSGMDGFIRNVRTNDYGPDLNTKQARAALHYDRGVVTIDARYDRATVRDSRTFEAELLNCPPDGLPARGQCQRAIGLYAPVDSELNYSTPTGTGGFSNLDLDEAVVTTRINLDPIAIVSTTAYEAQNAAVAQNLSPFPGTTVLGTASYTPSELDERFRQFTQELRVESRSSGPFEYAAGVYYEHNELNNRGIGASYFAPAAAPPSGLSAFVPPTTRVISLTDARITSRTISAFGSLTYHVTTRFSLTGGLRYSNVQKDGVRSAVFGSGGYFEDASMPFTPFVAAAQPSAATAIGISAAPYAVPERTDHAFMPSAIATYELGPGMITYASYSRGFKAGGFSGTSTDVFAPESVNAYELGLKTQFFNRRLTANLALFKSDYKNLQEAFNTTTAAGASVQVIANVASSTSKGIEFETRLRLLDGLVLNGSVAYLVSRYVNYPNSPCNPVEAVGAATPCVRDASGRTRAFAPDWSGSVGADYRHPLTSTAEFRVGGTVAFTTSYFMQSLVSDLVRQPGYAKIDARMAIAGRHDGWEVAVIGRNLTDRTTAVFRNYTPGSPGTVTALADRPRSVAVQLSSRW